MKMKKNIVKALAVVSVIIIVLGIVCGIGVSNDLLNVVSGFGNIYADGSDVTEIAQLFGSFGAMVLGFLVALCGFAIVLIIWVVYAVFILAAKLYNHYKQKDFQNSANPPSDVK